MVSGRLRDFVNRARAIAVAPKRQAAAVIAVLFTRTSYPLEALDFVWKCRCRRSAVIADVDRLGGRIRTSVLTSITPQFGGAVAQLGARLDGIEEVVGSNPIGSTNL
jgi:hypothetical protein